MNPPQKAALATAISGTTFASAAIYFQATWMIPIIMSSIIFTLVLTFKGEDYRYCGPCEHKQNQINRLHKQIHQNYTKDQSVNDPINPNHYKFPGGIEPIDIAQHLNFNLGNVIKYVARAGRKDPALQDLKKAHYYLTREITRHEQDNPDTKANPLDQELNQYLSN